MLSAIKLTVGIPTYNRAADLRVALESVLAQADPRFRDSLEVLISDNASTDATQEVVGEFVSREPRLVTCHTNACNLGYSRNVDAVIRQARGEFVLLMSDDDGLEENALADLWDILSQYDDLGAVFLWPTPYDCDLRAPLVPAPERAGRKGGVLYRPGLEYVRQTRQFPPFLVSGYVVRREAWLTSFRPAFLDTICVHTLGVLPILSDFAVYVPNAPSIQYRTETKGFPCSRDALFPFTFFLDLLVGCREIESLYPAALLRSLQRQALRSIAYHIMRLNRILLLLPGRMLRIPFQTAVWARAFTRQKARRRLGA
jgi:hypothetical protein